MNILFGSYNSEHQSHDFPNLARVSAQNYQDTVKGANFNKITVYHAINSFTVYCLRRKIHEKFIDFGSQPLT